MPHGTTNTGTGRSRGCHRRLHQSNCRNFSAKCVEFCVTTAHYGFVCGNPDAGAGGAWTDGEKPRPRSRAAPVGYRPKDLILVRARFAMALQADGWLLRNAVVWHKRGIRPESAQDRFTRSYETIYLLTKDARYYFSQIGTREPMVTNPNAVAHAKKVGANSSVAIDVVPWFNAFARNGRDVWEIAKEPQSTPAARTPQYIQRSWPGGAYRHRARPTARCLIHSQAHAQRR